MGAKDFTDSDMRQEPGTDAAAKEMGQGKTSTRTAELQITAKLHSGSEEK